MDMTSPKNKSTQKTTPYFSKIGNISVEFLFELLGNQKVGNVSPKFFS
jgi:hypothetical protein